MHYHYKPHYSLISWIKIVIGSVIAAASFRFFSYHHSILHILSFYPYQQTHIYYFQI